MARIELDEALLVGLTRFIDERDRPPRGRMSPDEAVNTIVEDWLIGQGFIALPDDPSGTATAFEAAAIPKD